jgi:hypothetical protein
MLCHTMSFYEGTTTENRTQGGASGFAIHHSNIRKPLLFNHIKRRSITSQLATEAVSFWRIGGIKHLMID